ncbi:unnamed protein product [Cuscuta campestris]|uniref:Uncharacterized protein n=1 Tax=Cuscuta campestris TaxID=132261 RepID=A0A484KLY2_9ASTE|nr:unnamed protein product [Cuscuta campestris]
MISLQIRELQAPTRRRCMSRMRGLVNRRSTGEEALLLSPSAAENEEMRPEEEKLPPPPSWRPHPRTGIYFPAGQEGVMDDVPSGAAALSPTYWLRNVDGVDKPF